MTDTVRVPRAWLEAFCRDTDPTEPIADNGGTVWDMFCHEAAAMLAASPQEAAPTKREAALADLAKLDGETMDLAASPQGEGSSAEWITHDGGPNPVPGKQVSVRFPDGDESVALHSECFDWSVPFLGVPEATIIAYRVIEGVKP